MQGTVEEGKCLRLRAGTRLGVFLGGFNHMEGQNRKRRGTLHKNATWGVSYKLQFVCKSVLYCCIQISHEEKSSVTMKTFYALWSFLLYLRD